MMLAAYGPVPVDLAPLCAAVQAIPPEAWHARSDPESDQTSAVRENDPYFPRVCLDEVLTATGRWAFGTGWFNRVVLSRVPAGCGILPHTDDFGVRVQSTSWHCHLPLITDPTVVLGGPEGETHLLAGHLYTMDARCRHWVRNPSAIDRVHLLFAYFPETGLRAA